MVAAIYCRLSKEDEDRRQESESIQNQKSMLVRYAAERAWEIYDIYVDDDYSGADRDRPQFNRMLRDAEKGRFSIVLVKTQSRFTRDMECVEQYIHGKFPEWGVRFVSMVDNADTEVKGNKKARQINGLINEWYLEDLSDSVRSVLDNKRRNGQFIGSFCCYGYKKDPADRGRLAVDGEAAQVVRKIFALALQGNGRTHIAKLLNEAGVPNPSAYKRQQGLNFRNGRDLYQHGLWCPGTVGQILKNPVYTGVLIQGKQKKAGYKSKKLVRRPESEWFVTPDSHEAIIDKETFALVQRMAAARPRASGGSGQVYSLAGLVYCGECGSVLHRCRGNVRRDGRSVSYLRCKLHSLHTGRCANRAVRLDHLSAEVDACLRRQLQAYFDWQSAAPRCIPDPAAKRRQQAGRERQRTEAELERHRKALAGLYLDKANGLIGEEQFAELNRTFLAEKSRLEARLQSLPPAREAAADREEALRHRWERLRAGALDRELAVEFIRRVVVYGGGPEDPPPNRDKTPQDRKIVIEWKF